MGSIKRDILFNTLSNFLQFGTRWLLNVVLARTFPSTLYGQFTLIYSSSTIFSSLFAFGSNLFLLHKAQKDISILIRSILLSTVLFLVTSAFIMMFFPSYLTISLLGFVLALNTTLFFYYKGMGWFDREAKLYILFSVSLLILIILVLKNLIVSIEFIIWILISINIAVFILGFIYICYSMDCKKDIRTALSYLIKTELKERFAYGIHEILSILFKNLEFVLLGIYAGNKSLGEYRAIYNLVFPFYIIATITSQVLLSKLSVSSDLEKIKLLKSFVIKTGTIGILVSFILLSLYYPLIELFYGKRFLHKIYFTIYLLMLANLIVYLIKANFEVALTAIGKQGFRVKVLLFSTMLLLIFDFIAIRSIGVVGHTLSIVAVNMWLLIVYFFNLYTFSKY